LKSTLRSRTPLFIEGIHRLHFYQLAAANRLSPGRLKVGQVNKMYVNFAKRARRIGGAFIQKARFADGCQNLFKF